MSYLSVTKFSAHQHYRDRRPPWVKFYVALLDPHHPMNELPVSTRYLFDRLLLLAAEYDNAIPNDSELIAKLLRMKPRECREGLAHLEKGRWIKRTRTRRRASKPASQTAPDLHHQRHKEQELIKPPTWTPDWNGLPISNELVTARLIQTLGPVDEKTLANLRAATRGLPEGVVAKVMESVVENRPRNRPAYALAALRAERRT